MNKTYATVILTPKQVEIVDWALDAMNSMGNEDYKELGIIQTNLPVIFGRKLMFPEYLSGSVLSDLIYRIGEQYCDMAKENPEFTARENAAEIRSAESIVKKLKGLRDDPRPAFVPGAKRRIAQDTEAR